MRIVGDTLGHATMRHAGRAAGPHLDPGHHRVRAGPPTRMRRSPRRGRDDWEDLAFGGALLLGFYTVLLHPGVSYRSGSSVLRAHVLVQGANIELVPGVRQFAPILRRYAPRVMTAQAAPPDPDGAVNLSLHLGATLEELEMAGHDPDRLLVIEVNPHLPRTCSLGPEFRNTIPLDLIDVIVEADGVPRAPGHPARRRRPGHRRAGPGVHRRRGHPADRHRAVPNMVASLLPRGRAAGTGSTARCSPTAS